MRKKIIIFYDGEAFPQTLQYCYVWSLFCNDLNAMVRCKEFNPTCQDYSHIYFLIKAENKSKYQRIIDSHKKFPCTFIDSLPDYRGQDVAKLMLNFKVKDFCEPFSDMEVKRHPGRPKKTTAMG